MQHLLEMSNDGDCPGSEAVDIIIMKKVQKIKKAGQQFKCEKRLGRILDTSAFLCGVWTKGIKTFLLPRWVP
jgi:hypothetical protein